MSDRLLLGTRKGTIILDRGAKGWDVSSVGHYGTNVSFVARDPRDGTLWAGLDHGHWGTKLSRSRDNGKTWADAPQITYPADALHIEGYEGDAFPGDAADASARKPIIKEAKLGKIWSIAFGGADQPGRIWVGTIPGGLFVSNDGGETWELNRPLWNHESRGGDLNKGAPTGKQNWFGGGAVIDGKSFAGIHSIVVDPRDSRRVLIGISCAGVLETTDDGKSWVGRNKGLKATFLPNPEAEWGHDPHLLAACPTNPDYLWQQNHCGVFASTDGARTWREVSKPELGVHFGFPVVVDEQDGRAAWLVPGIADDKRMAVGGGLFVARTQDGGASWQQLRNGLPQERAHDIVYRHALDKAGDRLAFGSTTGNLYVTEDRGETWHAVGNSFPPIYSVRFTESQPRQAKAKAAARSASKSKPAPKKKPAKAKKAASKKKPSKAKTGARSASEGRATPKKKPAKAKKAAAKKAAPKKKPAKAKKASAKKPAPKKKPTKGKKKR